MPQFIRQVRELPSAIPGQTLASLPALEVRSGLLAPDDDIVHITGDQAMIKALIQNPLDVIGEDFRATNQPEVTILFSYPEHSEENVAGVTYTVFGVRKTSVLIVRAVRLPGLFPEIAPGWLLESTNPDQDIVHVGLGDEFGAVYSHFHLGGNDAKMREAVSCIALDPDGYLEFVNKKPQVARIGSGFTTLGTSERFQFVLPDPEVVSSGALPRSRRELRYLFQWLPDPAPESNTCTCNKKSGIQVTGTQRVMLDTFVTTTYNPCPKP